MEVLNSVNPWEGGKWVLVQFLSLCNGDGIQNNGSNSLKNVTQKISM